MEDLSATNTAPETDTAVRKFLRDFGVPEYMEGYTYCRKAITMLLENAILLEQIKSCIYRQIAKENGVTVRRVRREIRRVIGVTWTKDNRVKIDKHFRKNLMGNYSKPTDIEFIVISADRIRRYMNLGQRIKKVREAYGVDSKS